jgi:hypothetical protein
MPLGPGESWFDVIVLLAGLQVPARIELAPDVALDQILETNLVAQAVRMATEVTLGLPDVETDPPEPLHPVCGLLYRVRGKIVGEGSDTTYNAEQIEAPKRAFLRAIALLRGLELGHGGTFVHEVNDAGRRRLHSSQLNSMVLSVHYEAARFDEGGFAEELRGVFVALQDPYLSGEGVAIGVAIDRLGLAGIRANPVDANLDLCIAAEIAFRFGHERNEKIAETIRENARVFFGDGEFLWDRNSVFEIVCDSYRERSHTVHGRRRSSDDKHGVLLGLNARLREVLKASLRAYVERRPTRAIARKAWPARHAAVAAGKSLNPIFE